MAIVDLEVIRGTAATSDRFDLIIEIPHGATATTDFTGYEAQLTSALPANLVDFFHVNTDAGAPELGVAAAKHLVEAHPARTVAIVRSRIPRTFIDCNRRMDASPADFKAGKVTPGLMPWITTPEDRSMLRAAYDRYVGTVAETVAKLSRDGAMLMLHTYAPRSVDIEVGPDIVDQLHRAYRPEIEPTWKLRPEVDVIGKTLEGVDHAPRAVVDELAAQLPFPLAHGDTYPMHPSTLAYDHVMAHPGRAVCIEFRRDLLADPFRPFHQQIISPAKVELLALPLARALARWF